MLPENMTPAQLANMKQIANDIAVRKKDLSTATKQVWEEIKPPADITEFNEAYIIELFTITENQATEIQHLKNTITEQQTLINHLMEKLKVIGEVVQTDVAQKVAIRKVDIVEEIVH